VIGWALACFSFVIALFAALSDMEPLNKILGKKHFHDIGKLMLALVMVWAYFNFSQYLIIWSGNIPEETPWYLKRMEGIWGAIGIILIVFHFAVPFLILLSRDIKRNAKYLALVGVFILLMRLLDIFYHIAPSPNATEGGADIDMFWILYIVGPIAVGGIWMWSFFGELQKRPMMPAMDPFFGDAIEHGKGH
jgi:heme/copper-type cytochrome/quinol oxidase subunit 4